MAEAQYIKATTPDDPKSTDAARFLFNEAGISERQAPGEDAAGQLVQIMGNLVEFAMRIVPDGSDNYNYRNHDVIDADEATDTTDTDTDEEENEE